MPDKKVHNYQSHAWCIKALGKAQEADSDNRERAREAHLFLDKRSGMWEQEYFNANDGKPRYTFDLTTPIVEQIVGELDMADFGIKVDPASGDTTQDDADLMAGIVRAIENISDARNLAYGPAARNAIIAGIDGWRVTQRYVDADSFDQDLCIEHIPNYVDRVWFDLNSERRDHADARHAWVMTALSEDAFQERWPNRSKSASVDVNEYTTGSAYWRKRGVVIVGEFYYIESESRELALMSNGKVYEVDDKYQAIQDELAQLGITEVARRKRDKDVVYMRKFDQQGWLEEPQRTVFKHIPVVPEYANFKVVDNKIIYRGVVEKLLDPQRVLNYSLSREIEEGALAPRAKYWMTETQAEGYEDTLQTLNTNTDPVQFFNPDPENPGVPQQTGGAQVNPGLRNISMAMSEIINQSAGLFAANMGDNPNAQSGVAIEKLQDKGDTGTVSYTRAHEIAIAQTFRILVGAIPEVYSDEREMRIINEDRTDEVIRLNEKVMDQQTGQWISLNDLTRGTYKVTCRAGPAFKNRQEQTVDAMIKIATVTPEVLSIGSDVLFSNMTSPGMDLVAERMRNQLIQQGIIPYSQMTDDEKAAADEAQQNAANQEQPQDPAMLLGQAELIKAQTDQQDKQGKLELQAREQQRKELETQIRAQGIAGQQQIAASKEQRANAEFQADQQQTVVDQMIRMQQQQNEQILAMANTLKAIREAMGVDGAISPDAAEAFQKQASALNQSLPQGPRSFEYDPFSGVMEESTDE